MPKISVIMGIYNTNSPDMVKTAIDSILNQTFKDFEFIICDDGSDDGTYELVKKLTAHDTRVQLIKNERNMGLAASLNRCLEMATGTYIARMDADDSSLPTRLEEQLIFLENNSQYALVTCWADLFSDDGVWGQKRVIAAPEKKDLLFGPPFIHAAMLFRTDILKDLGGYRVCKETLRAEDYDLWMRLYAAGHKGYNLQKILYQIREDKNAYSRRKYRYRLDEAKVRYRGFKLLELLPGAWPYVVKPLVVGLIPQQLLARLRKDGLS